VSFSSDIGIVLSFISPEGCRCGFDDVSQLFCSVDGFPCRDFVHCLRFRDKFGELALVWVCPRFHFKSRGRSK
jgi:hypothetical protein